MRTPSSSRPAGMKTPLDSVAGTILCGFALTVLLLVILRAIVSAGAG